MGFSEMGESNNVKPLIPEPEARPSPYTASLAPLLHLNLSRSVSETTPLQLNVRLEKPPLSTPLHLN
jgi:hypothetical protein